MSTPQPATLSIDSVGLAVADLERSINYYRDRIGLEVQHRTTSLARLGVGERSLLELEARPDAVRDPAVADLFHVALLLPSAAALARTLHHLEATQTPLTGASDHGVSEALYLRDPDGHGLELYRDRPRSDWYQDGQLRLETSRLDFERLRAAGNGSATEHLDPDTVIGHIHLEAVDLDGSIDFYTRAFGLDVMARRPGASFMSVGGYHHHVAVNDWSHRTQPADRRDGGLGMLWYRVVLPDQAAIAAVATVAAGAPVADTPTAITDPSGHVIHLTTR